MRTANRIRVEKDGDRWVYFCGWCFGPEPRRGLGRWSHQRAVEAACQHWQGRHGWKLQNVCPRCANGLPDCTTKKPDGTLWTHQETCERYEWAEDLCPRCEKAVA